MSTAVRTPGEQPAAALGGASRVREIAANADVRAVAGLALFFALLATLSWRKWGVPSIDSGHELTVAATIAEGGEPYRDIRYFYGPLGVYSLAGAFTVFGTGFTTAFAFGLTLAAAIAGAFYALARQLLRVLPAFLATAVVVAIGFSGTAFNFVLPHTDSATFGILLILLTLLALCRGRLVPAGVAIGFACLTRPEFAGFAVLAAAAYLVGEWRQQGARDALRALPRLALPALAVAVPVLAWLAAGAGASNLFTENLWPVDFIRVGGLESQQDWAPLDLESVASTLARATVYLLLLGSLVASAVLFSKAEGRAARAKALWPLPAALAFLVLGDMVMHELSIWPATRDGVQYEVTHLLIGMSWLPALGFGAAIAIAFRLVRKGSPPLTDSWGFDLALVAVAAALGARAYDAFTLEASYAPYYAAPLVLLLALLHDRLADRWPQARTASYAALAGVAVGLAAYAQVGLYRDNDATVNTPRGSFVTTAAAAPGLQGAVDYIGDHTAPGEPLLAVPSDAGLNFMTDRPPALYNPMFLPGLLDSRGDELAAIAAIDREHVRYAVVSARRFDGYGFSYFGEDYNRLLAARIEREGPPVARFGGGLPAAGTNPATLFEVYRLTPGP
jgi:4-amino-4-deoxy-L-arabinose transferase-like glycosyltransferase